MLVKERMSPHPITIAPDTLLPDALRIMRENNVRRLPVLDKQGKLVGIVLEKELLFASAPPATSLSVWELNYLISKIRVSELMTPNVITVDEDCPIEEAARIMADHKIGGLPVMRGESVVGMITESDLFGVFLELLGARAQGLRVTISVPDQPGLLARLTHELARRGANIVTLGAFLGDDPIRREIVFKVQGLERDMVQEIIHAVGAELLDIRNSP